MTSSIDSSRDEELDEIEEEVLWGDEDGIEETLDRCWSGSSYGAEVVSSTSTANPAIETSLSWALGENSS